MLFCRAAWPKLSRLVLFMALCIGGIIATYYGALIAATMPPLEPMVVAGVFAVGFLLCGAAAFCLVLFSFLMVIARPQHRISNNLAHVAARVAHPLQVVSTKPPESQTGSFLPHDEETAFMQERLEQLQQAGHLEGMDLMEIMKEGHTAELDIDLSKMKGVDS